MFIDKLVKHILDTPFEAIPAASIEHARLRLIDVASCTVGGARADGNQAMLDLVREWGGNHQATVLFYGDRVALPYAAMLNSLQSRSFDFEVTGPEAEGSNAGKMVGHVCSTTEPTALAVGEYCKASGTDLLAAVVIGGDVAARMAVADDFDFEKSFEVCGTANAFGATAIAGRLLGASHDQLVNAFGILANLMAGSFQSLWDGVDTFKLPGAMAAYNGILAVQLAMRGFTGLKDPVTSPHGYFHLYCNRPQPENVLEDLGAVFYSQGMHKMHPSCYGNHNPIDSTLEILRNHSFAPEDVVDIALEVPTNRVRHFLFQPMTQDSGMVRALFSIPFAIANAIVRREVRLEHYTAPMMHDARVCELSRKVRFDPVLEPGNNQASRLIITLTDGRKLEAARQFPRGWAKNPVTADDVRSKYWRNVEYAGDIPQPSASQALELLDTLESVPDVSVLPRLFVRK